jgi:GT2 family glycosyltransferase
MVEVVTLNWNGAAFLQECVDSILASDYPNFQVIVVDNGSSDDSLELLDRLYGSNPSVTVIKNGKNLGYSQGMNVGLKHGFDVMQAGYCLVMNNDTRLDARAIYALVEVAEQDEKIAFVTGKVYYDEAPDTFQTVGKKPHPVLINGGHIGRGEKDRGQYDEDCELAFCDDIFWLVSRQVYQQTGGYDPEFFLQAEDFDWQLRAKNAGFKIMYAHKARLWHRESMTLGKMSARKAYYDARNPIVAVMKNCEPDIASAYQRVKTWKMLVPSICKKAIKGDIGIACALLRGLISAWIWRFRHT